MPTSEGDLPYRSRLTARTAGASSSSRYRQPSYHSLAVSGGTQGGSASREYSEAPPAYQSQAFSIPKGARLQLGDVEEPREQSIAKGARPSSTVGMQEPSVVKQRTPSLRDRKQPHQHHHAQNPLSASSLVRPSFFNKTQEPTNTRYTPSAYQPSSCDTSRRNQAPSIIKQSIYSQKQPLQHRLSRILQELTLVKQPFPSSSHEQPRYTVLFQKERTSGIPNEASQFKFKAPPTARSVLTTLEDIQMATRQTRIESLRPEDRRIQERWAQSVIKRVGVCPEHYAWRRMPGGYQCEGGGHGITDELLAEGKGGMVVHRTARWDIKEGPFYPDPDEPGQWVRYDGGFAFRGY